MIEREYQLTLTLEGPILSQASGALAFGLDAAMQRYREEPVLNGTQVRGNISHVLNQFRRKLNNSELDNYLSRWFPEEDPNYQDQRSPLNFAMFWHPLCKPAGQGNVRTRIQIEPDSGKVARGALAIAEDLYPSGSCVPFQGSIHARFKNHEERQAFEKWLEKALQWLSALGANKGVGYGRLLYHELEAREPKPVDIQAGSLAGSTRLRLKLSLDRPFCIARQESKEDNRFISSEDIPGHVIKGVLARKLSEETGKKDTELSNALDELLDFDRLVVTHAKPVPNEGNERPQAIPLNLAQVDGEWQSFTSEQPPQSLARAPEFQPDWKSETWDSAYHYLKMDPARPDHWLTVRTAIDPATSAAKESQLFSMECIDPPGFQWWAEIDLSAVDENRRAQVLEKLQALLAGGLDGIGKTHARAQAHLESISPPELPGQSKRWQITLQSPARMLPLGAAIRGANSHEIMKDLYQEYWDKASDGLLKLSAWFSQQRLEGGNYHHHRFRRKQQKSYLPELITQPGSVFILEINGEEEQAMKKLNEWLRRNLPAWSSDTEPANWRTTVHLPENGFGEITVTALNGEDEA